MTHTPFVSNPCPATAIVFVSQNLFYGQLPQENGFFFSRVRMRMRVRVFTHKPTNEGNEVSGNRKDNTVKEADLITTIKKYLATLPETFAWKEHGGQYGTAGIPDIIVCHRGRFIALEAKVGKNQPTKLQAVTIEQIRKAGGTAAVVRSVADVKTIISELED